MSMDRDDLIKLFASSLTMQPNIIQRYDNFHAKGQSFGVWIYNNAAETADQFLLAYKKENN